MRSQQGGDLGTSMRGHVVWGRLRRPGGIRLLYFENMFLRIGQHYYSKNHVFGCLRNLWMTTLEIGELQAMLTPHLRLIIGPTRVR